MRRYLVPDSAMTLREGIEELRLAEGGEGDASARVSPELARYLDLQDAIHVVFGCRTTLAGEVLAHVWAVSGTTAKLRHLHRVSSRRDHRAIVSEIGHARLLRVWVSNLPEVAGTVWRTLRVTKRWPVEELPAFLDRPLKEIRAEFGVRLRPQP